jgi:4-hydroxy-tetrahydrodipicolinate reductase
MGRTVTNIVSARDDCQIVAGVDIVEDSTLGYPVFSTFSEVQVKADVIVDFLNPALLLLLLWERLV